MSPGGRRLARRAGAPVARIAASLLPAVALAVGLGAATVAAAPSATARLGAPVAAPVDGNGRATDADLAAQRDTLARLRREIGTRTDAVERARATLHAATAEAAAALERYTVAEQRRLEAVSQEEATRTALLHAQLELAGQRAALGRWARSAYAQGGLDSTVDPTLATLLSGRSSDDVAAAAVLLARVGHRRALTVAAYEHARTSRTLLATRATAAATAATAAAAASEAARRERQEALERQAQELDAAESALSDTRGAEATTLRRIKELKQQQAADVASAATPSGIVALPGGCSGGSLSGFPNGRIPADRLCPLWGAPGHRLRADAAAAFSAMSQAYAAALGTPICVTDSYRSYAAQVSVYARKPHLAAVPGTSNHGWGRAVDLCGGVQRFGTRQHEWLVSHGPVFGWFHPAWARAGGSRPEPWHFEFGG